MTLMLGGLRRGAADGLTWRCRYEQSQKSGWWRKAFAFSALRMFMGAKNFSYMRVCLVVSLFTGRRLYGTRKLFYTAYGFGKNW
jgi:hypothetical protein